MMEGQLAVNTKHTGDPKTRKTFNYYEKEFKESIER